MKLYLNIRKTIGDFKLNMELSSEADKIGILGASGSGKSMTLRCIAGIETPDSGVITLDGRTLFDSSKKINVKPQDREIGYLFQNYALFPTMTVKENISCGIRDKDRKTDNEVNTYIEQFHLTGLEGRYPHELSGGQQQRVALARIMAGKPKLVLLDEPFSALDSYLRDKIRKQTITALEEAGLSIIIVSHDKDDLLSLSDEIFIIHEGEMVTDPKTDEAAQLMGFSELSEGEKMEFTHFDSQGNARIVDVSQKEVTHRVAEAAGTIKVSQEIMDAILGKKLKKGEVFTVAQIAGIMAVKKTPELIPLCHSLAITNAEVTFEVHEERNEIDARCKVETDGKTGVEMEAMTGVSTALLTIYDMCKAIDKGMIISDVRLVMKSGGKSGLYEEGLK